jgi:raffinose/stachyose/melibiose transport system permease protein
MWLGDTHIALISVALVDGWRYWGFLMVLFLAALHQTDKAQEEAATVEGAGKLQIFWHVILPQMRPTVMLILMLTMIWSFAAFDYVYVMTGGGPGNATELIATYMYKEAMQSQAPGYASTIALAMALFSFIIIAGFGILKKRGWDI